MKNYKSYFNKEIDTTLEYLIINLIHQGLTINELLEPTNRIKSNIERNRQKKEIIQIILNFIDKNPYYIYLINDNYNASELLSFIISDY